jgi:chromate reductase, NAD(P)H dehydrogenase (quinone)
MCLRRQVSILNLPHGAGCVAGSALRPLAFAVSLASIGQETRPLKTRERNCMASPIDVVALVGSLRRDSFTRRLARGLSSVAPASLRLEIVPIGELPLYNQDLEEKPPQAWVEFRDRVRRADAVLFATPEYNRSVPGVLKNAIDVGSRPYGKSVWNNKPAAVVSNSPGAIGAFGANHHLRQSLVYLNMPTLNQPEAYVGGIDKAVDESGQFTKDETRKFCASFMSEFERWIIRLQH